MTIPRLRALHTAWTSTPPATMSLARIAAGLGAWKPQAERPRTARRSGHARADFAALFGG